LIWTELLFARAQILTGHLLGHLGHRNATGRAGLSVISGNQRSNPMNSIKTITTAAALALALSGYALGQSTLRRSSADAPPDGGAVDSSRGAVDSARSAVNAAPSAAERTPSAVERTPSAVDRSSRGSASGSSSGTTSSDGATSTR